MTRRTSRCALGSGSISPVTGWRRGRVWIGLGHGISVVIADELGPAGQDRIADRDLVHLVEHRIRERGGAAGAEPPLDVADPEHELRDRDPRAGSSPAPGTGGGCTPRSGSLGSPSSFRNSSTSPSRRFISSSDTYRKLPVPQAGSSTIVVAEAIVKALHDLPRGRRAAVEQLADGVRLRARSQSSRSGSMIVGTTSRST